MRLLLISPPFGEKGQMSQGLPIAPPVLEYLAGLTARVRPDVDVVLHDANKVLFEPSMAEGFDLVGFTVLTPQAPWVYRTADALRNMNIPVVAGGIHVTALPDEAEPHLDALVLGEAESVWKDVLDDAGRGRLRKRYKGTWSDLCDLPRPVTRLLPKKGYVYGYFQTSRGCPHRCAFCSVHEFFGGRVRMRPIDDVVREVAGSSWRLFWGIDDNIWGVNLNRSIELYTEMAKNVRGKWWFGSGDLVTVQNPKAGTLLTQARRAGLTAVLVGWESNNQMSLEEYRAVNKQGRDRRDAIRRIRDHGIEVMLFIMVGGRQDTRRDFDGILELCEELKISAHPVMTTPLPGTKLYEEYKPYIFKDLDWDCFDGNRALFEHPTMSPQEREEALMKLRAEIFTIPRILSRIPRISWRGFPMSHITSWMVQFPQGRAFTEYARNKGVV